MYNKENAELGFSCFSVVEQVSLDAATTTRIKYTGTGKSSVGEKVKVIKVAANTYL